MRLFSTVIATLSLSVIVLSGCGPKGVPLKTVVLQRAQFDFNCSREKLTVHHLGGEAFGIVGCGQKATYVVTCHSGQPVRGFAHTGICTAILNSDSKKPSIPRETIPKETIPSETILD
ncbi:hypothetical protein KKD49_08860 [Myxococcota bacterium]|nr:hypothetical protein [Myxococcota bacterium]